MCPSTFQLLKVVPWGSGGFSICAHGRSFRYDLSKVIEHTNIIESANSTPTLRTVEIPFPEEFAQRILERQSRRPDAVTYDQLFTTPMETLQQSTRSWLRSISVSSHRLTLSRLIRTWSRYVLATSRDEAYASLIAMDFTIGTTANFNYLSIRSDRLKEILQECYRRLGYSGALATEEIEDVLSQRLPNSNQVASLINQLSSETAHLIISLPRHCPIDQLTATHNKVAINIYTLVKFLGGSRPLAAETITQSQLDLAHALVAVIDKRVSPYHQERLACLPQFSTTWLNTLLAWLELIAYRLGGIDPKLAALIHSATLTGSTTDWHPLFFIFVDGLHTAPIGSKELADTLARFGIANNGGRHWVDALLHDANIDRAVSMGHAGRGNPGQELFARWSAATPAIALKPVAEAVDRWLTQLDLPPIPALHPRHFQCVAISQDIGPYTPSLLQSETAWMALPGLSGFAAPEPCPFSRSTIASASSFPDLFRQWRSNVPPPGWLGVTLSLIFEDGVVHPADLFGALAELKTGTIFMSEQRVFVDSRTRPLGIRRINLSQVTRRLACRIANDDPLPTTFDALEKLMRSEKSPSMQFPPIRWIIDCAEAYFTLHAPAAISAWARGQIFARTTRPETTARSLYGCLEPIKFDQRRRVHGTAISNSVAQALEQAKADLAEGKSHERVLFDLHNTLSQMTDAAQNSTHAWIEIGYLSNLATTLDNLHTLLRYENGARAFVKLAADAIDQSGLDEVDWRQTVKRALESRQDGSAPDITGINAVLQWLGIDLHVYKRTSAPPSARTYAETVSAREVDVAENILQDQQVRPGDEYHLAYVALRLMSANALRWDSVAHIRLCDLALTCRSPHLVICKEAGADLKTGNAPRVILLTDPELVQGLTTITELRKARFPHDLLVPVFGDLHHSRSIETAGRIHTLITDALWRATGSRVVCVHDLRHHAITERIHSLLRPDSHREFDTLKLRQGLIECAIDAGQSWPQVAVENYGHDFDVLRSQHFARLIGQLTPPSDQFFAAVAGVSCTTLRKRRSRDSLYKPDLLDGFDWSDFRAGATITPLASLVNRDQTHLPVTKEDRRERPITPQAIYVGLRLLGEPSDAARMVSGLAEVQARPFDHALASAPRRHGAPLKARGDINRQAFLDAALNSALAVAMYVVRPDRQGIARIELSLRCIGDEWTFRSPQDALGLAPWVNVCAANDIGIEFLLRPGKRSLVDGEILDQARRSGFAIARTLPARHFPRGKLCISDRHTA